jgi:hypothetical protein
MSCGLSTSLGQCKPVPAGGTDPGSRCPDEGPASCRRDGQCDGAGACRLYAASTPCMPASCPGGSSTLTLGRTCDGAGTCLPATTQACAPYQCNGLQACKAACTVDADCLAPNICDPQTNLCGNKKRLGQACAATTDCLTGATCVDGVCCSKASCATCQSCAIPGFAGSCTNIPSGSPALHGACAASPPCGNTGNCNGAGACEQAGVGVACGTASCAGSTYTPVSHCTGAGACATATTSSCSPYACGASACLTTCSGDGDCLAPYTCQGATGAKSCALKANGLACTAGAQCISGHCTDGVCCGSASCAACQACNVGASAGACAPVAAGTPAPTTFCTDQTAATCGTNGKCDGLGGCQKYADGTTCAAASCAAGTTTLKAAGSCNAGACAIPTSSCSPYYCNGGSGAAAACHNTCATDGDCVSTAYCATGGTCAAKKAQGDACTANNQCGTGNCVDGVCCASPACGSCQACNVGAGANAGTCQPVAAGTTDPKAVCLDNLPASCGTNGKCDGAGGCQKYADGTSCATATCPAGTATLKKAGSCSGGACSIPTTACAPYFCNGGTGAGAACHTTCNVDGDCASGNYCTGTGGTCVAKGVAGDACTTDHQCGTGHCVDLVCCGSASCGSCQACNVGASAGTCAPVAAGTVDPKGVCLDNLAASCGTNGKCDGAGGCQKYADGTTCAAATCPAGTATLKQTGTCSGGTCSVPTTACAPYFCNGGTGAGAACHATCSADGDCATGYYCTGVGGTCALKIVAGAACTTDHQCGTGHCVDLVCCGSASCGSCQACNVSAHAGTCWPVAAGTVDPKAVCTDNLASSCGTNGKCDGLGGCQKYADGTICSPASCPAGGSTLTNPGTCGGGACGATSSSCVAYKCDGTTACRTDCGADSDCTANYYCAGTTVGTCTAKGNPGATCGADNQCLSGNCVDGVCCDKPLAQCGGCNACNVTGHVGTCWPVPANADPHGNCTDLGAGACSFDGFCDGAGGCQKYANNTPCSSASCPLGSSTLTNAGACSGGSCVATTSPCGNFACDGVMSCNSWCNTDGDCATTAYCTGAGGSCATLIAQGQACGSNHECATGNCVDGYCCGSPSCAGCQSCGVLGSRGTCTSLPAGSDSNGFCPVDAPSTCGRNGKCDGVKPTPGCQKYDAGTVCLAAHCTVTTTSFTSASTCDGAGICVAGTASDCGAYLCKTDGTACGGAPCTGDGECSTGNTCQANVCAP